MSELIKGGGFILEGRQAAEVFCPEDLTEEHRMILKTTRDFIAGEVWPRMEQIEAQDEAVIRDLMRQAGELGLLSVDIPEEYGGLGLDIVTQACVSEAFGGGASLAVCYGAHTGIGTLPIVYFGNHEQKAKYLPKLATAEWLGAYALTEPGAGSDALNAATKAVLSPDGKYYILNGEKCFITNAGWAKTFVLYAKIDGQEFSTFIVERDFPGVSVGAEVKKMGIKGSSTRSVILEDAEVPVENLLFEAGKGHQVAFNILNIGRFKLAASAVGSVKLILNEATRYAKARVQFGRPIASFGLIQQKLAEMAMKIYLAEATVYRTAGLMEERLRGVDRSAADSGRQAAEAIEEYAVECSINKVFCSEVLDFVVDQTVQIFGGYGYIADYPAERFYRDARINRIFEGTNEINRLLIPGTIMRRAMKGRLPVMAAAQALAQEVMSFSPLAVEIPDEPLAWQAHQIEMTRKAALLLAGKAAQKYMMKLQDEQEILSLIADILIELYAMESGLLRAKKKIATSGLEAAALDVAMVEAYLDDTLPKIQQWGNRILGRIDQGDDLRVSLAALRKFTRHQPLDAIGRKRRVAEKVIDKGGWFLE